MYYATKRQAGPTRAIGLLITAGVMGLVLAALLLAKAPEIMDMLTETEVVIIEEEIIEDEEPPPPPPVDVDLPPPPPQVILPDFVFDTPPPPTAIQQVQQVARPAPPAAARPAPPPPPPAVPAVRPQTDVRRLGELFAEYYPAASLRAKEEGTVEVDMCVSIDGRISDVRLVRTSGFPRLDESTVKNLSKMRLKPAKDSAGKNVAWCNPRFPLALTWQLPE